MADKDRFRSHLYHEGYEERTEATRGGFKTKYVYAANYFRPMMSERQFLNRKVVNIALAAIAFALQIIAGSMSVLLNAMYFVNIFQTLAIIADIFSLIGVIYYATMKQNMEIHYYKRFHNQFVWAYLAGGLAALGIIITAVVGVVLLREGLLPIYIPYLIMYVVSCVCLFVLFSAEKSTQYECILPEEAG